MALSVPFFRLKNKTELFPCNLTEALDFSFVHPTREIHRISILETVDFIRNEMPDALGFYTAKEVLDYALRQSSEGGLLLEFGVFKGGSINYIADSLPSREIHGFDSFEGLPEDWAGFAFGAGTFTTKGRAPRVRRNVKLHKGPFGRTLPQWLREYQSPISFIHIDCDIYTSTNEVLGLLGDRIGSGVIIVFDEFFGYPNWKQHEYRAFHEFVRRRNLQFRYLCYGRRQVGVGIY